MNTIHSRKKNKLPKRNRRSLNTLSYVLKYNYSFEAAKLLAMTLGVFAQIIDTTVFAESASTSIFFIVVNVLAKLSGFIFIAETAYFWIINPHVNYRKAIVLWCEMFILSYIIFGIFAAAGAINWDNTSVWILNLFPVVTFQYWYFSTYLLLMFFAPLLIWLGKRTKQISNIIIILLCFGIGSVLYAFCPYPLRIRESMFLIIVFTTFSLLLTTFTLKWFHDMDKKAKNKMLMISSLIIIVMITILTIYTYYIYPLIKFEDDPTMKSIYIFLKDALYIFLAIITVLFLFFFFNSIEFKTKFIQDSMAFLVLKIASASIIVTNPILLEWLFGGISVGDITTFDSSNLIPSAHDVLGMLNMSENLSVGLQALVLMIFSCGILFISYAFALVSNGSIERFLAIKKINKILSTQEHWFNVVLNPYYDEMIFDKRVIIDEIQEKKDIEESIAAAK